LSGVIPRAAAGLIIRTGGVSLHDRHFNDASSFQIVAAVRRIARQGKLLKGAWPEGIFVSPFEAREIGPDQCRLSHGPQGHGLKAPRAAHRPPKNDRTCLYVIMSQFSPRFPNLTIANRL
jgi:hypothetical protein